MCVGAQPLNRVALTGVIEDRPQTVFRIERLNVYAYGTQGLVDVNAAIVLERENHVCPTIWRSSAARSAVRCNALLGSAPGVITRRFVGLGTESASP